MNRIKEIVRSNKVLFKNFTSLSFLQLSNYLFPIITLPYLVRVLGPDKYGLLSFATAFAGYFTILTDYGFNLSATKDVSVNRNDREKISKLFSSVITIKIFLFGFSVFIFLLITSLIPLFQLNFLLYSVTLLGVLGTALFPLWFYQGIEQMNFILVISVTVRIFTTAAIFVLINNQTDFINVAWIYSVTQIVIGVIGLGVAKKKFKIDYQFPSTAQIKSQLRDGWSLFLSTVWINLYTTSNAFILGLFAPNTVVGYYAAADKIRIASQGVLSSMSQSVFPYVNKILSESFDRFIHFNAKLLKIAIAVGIVISTILFLFADPIVNIVLGSEYNRSVIVLKIIAWLPFIIFLSNVYGIQTMLPMNKQKSFSTILFFAAVINLSLSLIFVPNYYEIGTSVAVLITELFVTISFYIFLKRNAIKLL